MSELKFVLTGKQTVAVWIIALSVALMGLESLVSVLMRFSALG
jgi:hypothetical protein